MRKAKITVSRNGNGSTTLSIEMWDIGKVKPYPKNARTIPQSAIDQVAASIREFKWRQPIVVEPNGTIILGHVRRLAAIQIGLKQVPVHVATDLTADQIKRLRIMDNRSHEASTWDIDTLFQELKALPDLSLTGFDEFDLQQFEAIGFADVDGADHDGEPAAPSHNRTPDRELMAITVIYMKDIADMERALIATGSRNRGEALAIICRSYLEGKKTTRPAK
jgi:ParB-like chromosome segregation protein Spo0J